MTLDGFRDARPAPEPLCRNVAEESLDHVEPRGAGRRRVHVGSEVSLEPALHFVVLVRGLWFRDHVGVEALDSGRRSHSSRSGSEGREDPSGVDPPRGKRTHSVVRTTRLIVSVRRERGHPRGGTGRRRARGCRRGNAELAPTAAFLASRPRPVLRQQAAAPRSGSQSFRIRPQMRPDVAGPSLAVLRNLRITCAQHPKIRMPALSSASTTFLAAA